VQTEKNHPQRPALKLKVSFWFGGGFILFFVSHLLCPGLCCCTFWFILLRRNLMQGQFARRRRRFLWRARACCWRKNNPAKVIPDLIPFFPCQGGQQSSMSEPRLVVGHQVARGEHTFLLPPPQHRQFPLFPEGYICMCCTNLPCNPRRNARRSGNRRPCPRKRGTAPLCHRILQRKDAKLKINNQKIALKDIG